jgi:hypothetical protein
VSTARAIWSPIGLTPPAAVHQLTPELAEDLAHAREAIFVDAYRADVMGQM